MEDREKALSPVFLGCALEMSRTSLQLCTSYEFMYRVVQWPRLEPVRRVAQAKKKAFRFTHYGFKEAKISLDMFYIQLLLHHPYYLNNKSLEPVVYESILF